jgi:hypothetical protein
MPDPQAQARDEARRNRLAENPDDAGIFDREGNYETSRLFKRGKSN